jgi:hypothetical protein
MLKTAVDREPYRYIQGDKVSVLKGSSIFYKYVCSTAVFKAATTPVPMIGRCDVTARGWFSAESGTPEGIEHQYILLKARSIQLGSDIGSRRP